jgi:Ca-activated chloride channel family protein
LGASWTTRLYKGLYFLKLIGISVVILAFARPQLGSSEEDILTEGVDIMIAIDISGSMAAEDFRPKNRISVAKQVVQDFVRGRQSAIASDWWSLRRRVSRSVLRRSITTSY